MSTSPSETPADLGIRLSILTPNYNYGRFIGDAIDSVTGQEIDVEHVVVDDGSTDETVEVLQHAPKDVVWRVEPHRGQCAALNTALSLATGDWIGWLNSDEFYLPHGLTTLARAADEHPDADLIYGEAVFIDIEGHLLELVAQHSFSTRVLRWNRCNISSCAMMIRRSAMPDRAWDEQLKAVMDWDLYLEIVRRGGRIVHIPEAIGAFRVHPEQITWEKPPPTHPDFRVLKARHRLPEGLTGSLAFRAGQVEHGVLKIVEGGLRREMRTRPHRGADIRWFRSPDALAAATAVEQAASGNDGGSRARSRDQHQS